MIRDQVRTSFPALDELGSLFDDIWLADEPELSIAAAKSLLAALPSVGMIPQLHKCSVYSTGVLTAEQLQALADLQIPITYDGFTMLGTPVGKTEFVLQQLQEKTSKAKDKLSLISEGITAGKLNNRLATPQGIYHLVRDCANQLQRHLLRTVDPDLTSQAFRPIDVHTQTTIYRLFDIFPTQQTQCLATRVQLPCRWVALESCRTRLLLYQPTLVAWGKLQRACSKRTPRLIRTTSLVSSTLIGRLLTSSVTWSLL